MTRITICRFLVCLLFLTALVGCTSSARQPETATGSKSAALATPAHKAAVVLSSPGRVEGASETIEVGAAMDGVIRAIYVQEGQFVKKGAKVADMSCPELPAELAQAEAEVDRARQSRVRIERGTREEERRAAEQRVAAAQATLKEAKKNLERMQYLVGHGAMARDVLDKAIRDHDVATAHLNESIRNEEFIKAPALPEDLAKADAEIQSAEQKVDLVKRRIYKCGVGAPADGTVLRVLLKPGESFSTFSPRPILTIADLSTRRIRAEIDERDVSRVSVGQRVSVLLEGKEDRSYPGHLTTLYEVMGRKKIRTGDPSEKADRDVLEAMLDLDKPDTSLPVGLRVIVRFEEKK